MRRNETAIGAAQIGDYKHWMPYIMETACSGRTEWRPYTIACVDNSSHRFSLVRVRTV